MLALPFPFIANTAGWITAEVGRQPWLIYGLMRTQCGLFAAGFRGQRVVHADRIPRHVHGPGNSVPVSRLSRDRTRPRSTKTTAGRRSRRRRIRSRNAMGTLWFCLVAVMLAGYVVLDGFDIGVGILHLWRRANRRRAARSSSARSARCGMATKCGSSPRVARFILRFRCFTRREFQRILSAADDGAVAADLARDFASSFAATWRPTSGPSFWDAVFCVRQHPARDFLWRRARQRGSRRSARRDRTFLRAALDEFPAHRRNGHSRLVHHPDRRCCTGRARHAWRHLDRLAHYRRIAIPRARRRLASLVARCCAYRHRHLHQLSA